jgi:hypothetical protein
LHLAVDLSQRRRGKEKTKITGSEKAGSGRFIAAANSISKPRGG